MLRRLQPAVLACAVLAFPILGWADVSGTPTLAVNTTLNLDTGATGSSGDITWTGTSFTAQPGATMAGLAGVPSSFYDTLDKTTLPTIFSSFPATPSVAVPNPSQGALIVVKTKGGNYAKLFVTGGTAGGSITVKFTTYGATGGGGGGSNGPAITTIRNNYGLIPPGAPNYGIAQSALFFVQGSNLSNTTTDLISSASPGLPTTKDGVTVSVTSGGTTLQCPLYYLSPTQIDAVLPGTTPLGTATVTVTNNGATSATFQIQVVQSAFGILSYNGSMGAAYDANNNLITANNAANPNQTIVLWGSGVGYDPNDDDKLFPQKQDNLTNIPMQAYVGGVQANIAYRGRSQFPGVDQVVLTIPGSVPTGCYVSLAIVSGNVVSNSVTIPIASSGRTCSDSNSGLTQDIIQGLSGKTTIRQGILIVAQSTSISSSGTTRTDNSVAGIFQQVNGFASSGGSGQVSIGSCLVSVNETGSGSTGTLVGLDAGAKITVQGPAGSLDLSQLSLPGIGAGFYAPASSGTVPGSFIPSNGGAFTFDNGAGGKDVQHFSATLNLPATFTWTNPAQISSVTRSQGVNVTWTGGASGTYVNISGSSTATGNSQVSESFTCIAPVSAGQFSVPVPVLLGLPAGNGSLSVGNYSNIQLFTAPGLDLGLLIGGSTTSKSLPYN